MTMRFKTSRFHIMYGPISLFERVQYKFQEPRTLKLHGKQFNERRIQKEIPGELITLIKEFNPNVVMAS